MYQLSEQHDLPFEAFKSKVNVNGGAIALGHPLEHQTELLFYPVHEMIEQHTNYGVASLCVGGEWEPLFCLKVSRIELDVP